MTIPTDVRNLTRLACPSANSGDSSGMCNLVSCTAYRAAEGSICPSDTHVNR